MSIPFSSNGVSGTVRAAIGEDIWLQEVIEAKLGDVAKGFLHPQRKFAQCLLLTESITGLKFDWPEFSPQVDIPALYEQWRKIPAPVMRAWGTAITAANDVMSDEATAPGIDPNA